MTTVTEAQVLQALSAVRDPDFNRDIVSLQFVKGLRIEDGRVSFTIELATPKTSSKEVMRSLAHDLVARIPGVTSVNIEMTANVRPALSPEINKPPVEGVKNVIAVGAGKGGVGKTTVAVNLAIALSQLGARVAMIDGDVYGPNVPIMLGVNTQLQTDGKKILPAEQYGIQLVSIGFLTDSDSPVIWRGPMLHGVIQQFFRDVRWPELDYLVVDLPPGTGDVALSLSQTVPVSGAVVVTTPQSVSVADTRRAVRMYQKLNIPTLGLIENMSHFVCPGCGRESDLFGKGGGEALAADMEIPFLGRIPLYEPVRTGGDRGVPIVIAEPESPAGAALRAAAERAAAQISISSYTRAIPLTPVR